MKMKCRLSLHIGADLDLYHAAKTYSGFVALAGNGEILLRETSQTRWPGNVMCAELESGGDRRNIRIAIDLRDQSDCFTLAALRKCDLYFKRNLCTPYITHLPSDLRRKLRPYGLNYGCVTSQSRRRLLARLVGQSAGAVIRKPGEAGRLLRAHARLAHVLLSLPTAAEFEVSPEAELEPLVLYQTRVWPSAEVGRNDNQLNEERVALTRALKRHFGVHFLGGLVPTDYARRYFPDEVTPHPTRRADYLRFSRRSLIGVYTRGVHQSIAFKLGEYLAGSKCIVAEPSRNELPSPLIEGKHFLGFRSPNECIVQCEAILNNRALASEMRQHNQVYYKCEVEPAAHLRVLLSEALHIGF